METQVLDLSQSWFQTHFTEIQFAAIFGGMVLFFLIEGFIPRRKSNENETNRWLGNIGLALFNHFFVLFFSIVVYGLISGFVPESPLLSHFKISDLPVFILLLFVMEFLVYWIHRLFHKVPFLWQIHAVHHTDTEIDVTTSHRHHPFEPMINVIILTPVILYLGAPFIVIALYNLTHTAFSLFTHSNIVLPKKLDKILRLFIVTPDFHRMHHSSDKKFTNSNYSDMIPWFDYFFRTYTQKPYEEIASMEVGLETLRDNQDSRLDRLFITPFIYKPKS
jgi:sterol desaturase/sphingolipid hydroxylase (fatty acid hydroxylase superfamily)